MVLQYIRDHRTHRSGIAEIGSDPCASTNRASSCSQPLRIARDKHHVVALRCELAGALGTKTTGSTGYDDQHAATIPRATHLP